MIKKANKILHEKNYNKTFADIPLNNPSKFLHLKLGGTFIDNTFVWFLDHSNITSTSETYSNKFLKIKNPTKIFQKITKILSQKFIDFFNINEKNLFRSFNVTLRKTSKFLLKDPKILVIGDSFAIYNSLIFRWSPHIDVYLGNLQDLYKIFKYIKFLNQKIITGRLFFKQEINYNKIQEILFQINIRNYINQTVIYEFNG